MVIHCRPITKIGGTNISDLTSDLFRFLRLGFNCGFFSSKFKQLINHKITFNYNADHSILLLLYSRKGDFLLFSG